MRYGTAPGAPVLPDNNVPAGDLSYLHQSFFPAFSFSREKYAVA